MWYQREISLSARARGVHLITPDVEKAMPELARVETGLLHLFIQHTSASLAVNENADPSVRVDLESHLNVLAPEHAHHYTHILEGSDDMPAHIKSVLVGCELTLPVRQGRMLLGVWQGIYLCEHRDFGGSRNLVLTLQGLGGQPVASWVVPGES